MLGIFTTVGPMALFLLLGLANAASEVKNITDVSIYTSMAPCLTSGFDEAMALLSTKEGCVGGATSLQSCICTNYTDSMSLIFSDWFQIACGVGTTEPTRDMSSASTMLSAYCNQDATFHFSTASYKMPSYIHEFDAFTNLAPCAMAALSSAVAKQTTEHCPKSRALLAPCACDDDGHSSLVSGIISNSVEVSCSSNSADVTSAEDLFKAYCLLLSGTTSMPTTTNPPGNMTYYITNLAEYSALGYCAQSAVKQAVMRQSLNLCPGGDPQALASCVCIKESVSRNVSSILSQRASCGANPTQTLSSAASVVDLYCSAAKGQTMLIVATTTSTTSARPARTRSGSNWREEQEKAENKGLAGGAIAGIVVGSAAGLIGLAMALWCLLQRRRGLGSNSTTKPIPLHKQSQLDSPAPDPNSAAVSTLRPPESRDGIPPPHADAEAAPPPYEPGEFGARLANNQRVGH